MVSAIIMHPARDFATVPDGDAATVTDVEMGSGVDQADKRICCGFYSGRQF